MFELRKPLVLSAALRPHYASRAERLQIRAKYAERLEHYRRIWEITRDPFAVSHALSWTFHHRQPIEPWIEKAVIQELVKVRTSAQVERHRDNMVHLDRYIAVRDARATGMKWEAAKQAAAEQLGISIETVWKSYRRVKRQFRERQPDRFSYWTINDVRYRHLA